MLFSGDWVSYHESGLLQSKATLCVLPLLHAPSATLTPVAICHVMCGSGPHQMQLPHLGLPSLQNPDQPLFVINHPASGILLQPQNID